MSQGRQYPIQNTLRRLIGAFESDRSDFARKLFYSDLEIGRLHLDAWLDRGEGYDGFLRRVATAFYDHAADLEQALEETAAMRVAEGDPGWRERCKAEDFSFVPFVHVQGERSVPNGIVNFGISGGHERWTTIHIPAAVRRLPVEEQLSALPQLMKAYLVEYRGACPFFGPVRSFIFVRLRDYYQFDQECQFIEHVQGRFYRGRVEVSLR
jgi:hypothetical protein